MVHRMVAKRNHSAMGRHCEVGAHATVIIDLIHNLFSVFDSDGDFLLIEAAEHLPAWVTPKNSENRVGCCYHILDGCDEFESQVWIYNGRMHLVPLQYTSPSAPKQERRMLCGTGSDDEGNDQETDAEYISIVDAINAVRNDGENTSAFLDVEQAAFRRIQGYALLNYLVVVASSCVPATLMLCGSTSTALGLLFLVT
jgi:SGT1 protein